MPESPQYEMVDGVRRIAVLRANAVGDLIFTLPALDALRAAYREAEIVLLGRAWHVDFLAGRAGPVDRVIALPPIGGLTAPVAPNVPAAAPADFVTALRAERFDLAIQLHGGGRFSNPFVRDLGARVTVGMRAPGSVPLDRWVRFNLLHNEVLRYLEAVSLAGARPVGFEPSLALTERDRAEALAFAPQRPYVVLHPGATDERRRWPAERFGRVGDRLRAEGYAVVVGGDAGEAPLVRRCIATMRDPSEAVDAAGRLSLGGYAALLARARLVIGNDTGPLHLARAVGAPTLVLYWAGNFINGGPMTTHRQRMLASWQLDCPVCGVANVEVRCRHDVSFLQRIAEEDVLAEALDLLNLCAGDRYAGAATSASSASHLARNGASA